MVYRWRVDLELVCNLDISGEAVGSEAGHDIPERLSYASLGQASERTTSHLSSLNTCYYK